MGLEDGADYNLDGIFSEIGDFGLFQIVTFFLICIPNTIAASFVVNYVFASSSLEYRSVNLDFFFNWNRVNFIEIHEWKLLIGVNEKNNRKNTNITITI